VQRAGAGQDLYPLASIEHIGRGLQAGQADLLLVLAPERGAHARVAAARRPCGAGGQQMLAMS
jgi:hypothetical protein